MSISYNRALRIGRTAIAMQKRLREWRRLAGAMALGVLCNSLVQAQPAPAVQPAAPTAAAIRLGVVEGLSGPFANAGEAVMRQLQFALERINARGGVRLPEGSRRLELASFDNKGQVEESLVALRGVVDQQIGFVLQGNSSAVAAALSEAVTRHNERNPQARMLFLNYSAVDPVLTNEKCSFWHFRFDAHADMRMAALTDVLKTDARVKRVYLINQDYSFGQQVARSARAMLAAKRPDVQIVGDELHPVGKVKDFAPYAAKLVAAGADAVITGNWGNDLSLLVKAAREAGLNASFYTFYGNSLGAPAAIAESGVGRVRAVAEWHYNAGDPQMEAVYRQFRARFPNPRDDYLNPRMLTMVEMLVAAMEKAGSAEPLKVARALEGMRFAAEPHEAWMRAEDHQLIQPLYVSVMQKAGAGGVQQDVEGSGYGFATERFVPAAQAAQPARCAMERP
jgi:branched-chain amino acid transport system substrate-binding protein